MKQKSSLMTVAIIFIAMISTAQQNGAFNESSDGKTYKNLKTGNQVWMTVNLAYKSGSLNDWAYNNGSNDMAKYGNRYNWQTAKNVNPTSGYRSGDAKWTQLTDFLGSNADTKLNNNGKYGALAIDKSNGFYYGWAVDYPTQSEADKRALKECSDKGGDCDIVLRFSGGYCAAYRTIDGDAGTAYGWGVAKTRSEANSIANAECLKRSNGIPCNNYVWGCNSKQEKEQDDFWKGVDDKKEETKDNNTDDFWSGGSGKQDKQDSNKETDFWAGKGTTAEEKQLTENTKPDKSDQFIGNVRSRTGRIRIYCEDTGKEDGDLVRITNNGRILKDKIFLTNAGKSYWFDLKFGQNNIEILALNQGDVGANTAAFKVFDDKGNRIAEKSWHLETGYKGKLLILKL